MPLSEKFADHDELFHLVVDASPAGMIIADRAGQIVLANPSAEAMFGYETGDLINESIEQLVPEAHRDGHKGHRDHYMANPRSRSMVKNSDFLARRKDGTVFPVDISLRPIKVNGDPMVLANVIDATERRRAEDEQRRSEAMLPKVNSPKTNTPNPPLLLVSNDKASCEAIHRIVSLDATAVESSSSRRDTLSRNDLSDFVAILLDQNLPDGDACEMIGELRTRAPDTSIIVITTHAEINNNLAESCQKADDYLIKPINQDALLSRLRFQTELYRVRQELRLSESRMRFLVENLPAGAVYVDQQNLFFNRAIEKMTGYLSTDIRTVNDWFEVLCGENHEVGFAQYNAVKQLGFREECVLKIIRKDGVEREIRIAGHRYDHHEVWLVTDITELYDAQAKLVQAERLAAIGQMVTGLAHESRNALQRARGCLDLLELDLEGQSEQLDLTARVRKALGDLQHNYEEVRQYAAPINLRRDDAKIANLIESAFDNVLCEYPTGTHRLEIEQRDTSAIRCDSHRMIQVFRNVIENSMAASPDGVIIRARISDMDVLGSPVQYIELSDNGPGMPENNVGKSFEPFFTTKQSGTGLGLPICQRIVSVHGGTISIRSEAGSGTTVTVILPLEND
ncbi:Sporulation kinase E [Planctomycetes bacterium CA13]|uniref:histidine kinase n=1 Tax=Novipirellula herctigrandis TaxID=2527986 RepID=A0A5C5Z4Y1_9BACT|nr:Sporulation kinase E [Planctomycetes bacterium CA13]